MWNLDLSNLAVNGFVCDLRLWRGDFHWWWHRLHSSSYLWLQRSSQRIWDDWCRIERTEITNQKLKSIERKIDSSWVNQKLQLLSSIRRQRAIIQIQKYCQELPSLTQSCLNTRVQLWMGNITGKVRRVASDQIVKENSEVPNLTFIEIRNFKRS